MPVRRSGIGLGFAYTGSSSPLLALRFPSNVSGADTAAPYAVIEFSAPQSNGLPAWGAANAGFTVIRKLKGHQQTGYCARIWYTRSDGTFDGQCWGAHPYPSNASSSGTVHIHEVATTANDFFDFNASVSPGDGHTVTEEQVYIQALKGTRAGANSHTLRDYINLPAVTTADYIEVPISSAGFMESVDASTKFVIGDSPWYAGYQHERASMDLYAIKIFAVALSEADILSEAANFDALVTSAGIAGIWWGKKGFTTVDALTCDYGTGRSFVRNDSSNLLSVV